jgi:predicted HTH transcriptional regulator
MRGDSRTAEIKKALEDAILSSPNGDEEILHKVMSALDKKKVLRYHSDDEISLLSTPGRVLVAILEDPTMTQRALSVYLDLSETMIDKTVKNLITKGIITKTKLNRQNIYKVDIELLKNHPDIQHFSGVINSISSDAKHAKQHVSNSTRNVGEDELF